MCVCGKLITQSPGWRKAVPGGSQNGIHHRSGFDFNMIQYGCNLGIKANSYMAFGFSLNEDQDL